MKKALLIVMATMFVQPALAFSLKKFSKHFAQVVGPACRNASNSMMQMSAMAGSSATAQTFYHPGTNSSTTYYNGASGSSETSQTFYNPGTNSSTTYFNDF